MASRTVASQAAAEFEFEVLDDDSDQINPWIEPDNLKLTQRLGKGIFGEVWLGTHNRSTENSEAYHEVAVKMFPLVNEERVNVLLAKLDGLFSKCHGLEGVCPIYGFSVISGKVCVVMKFCEGSIGDKVSRLKEGKLTVPDVLRYGIELARGILELHSRGILVLNLKPSNILLDENDKAILGDFGIPFLLFGSPSASSDVSLRFGTPNYMAPEQWQPEIRGPISFETDSWGFGCTVVEMLTGVRPWRVKSVEEMYNSVVRKHEKPQIPSGLPSSIENLLLSCFEYDLRNRPLISDILQVFQSSQNSVFSDGGLVSLGRGKSKEAPRSKLGYTEWFLLKEHLQVGDTVRSRKPRNRCRAENMEVPEGTVVGLEHDTDRDRLVLVRVHGIHDPMRIQASTLERVTLGLAAGDWLRWKENQKRENNKRSSVGVLHSIGRDGVASVGFVGTETLWEGPSSKFEMAEPHCLGQFVRLKPKVLGPRFDWPRKGSGDWATGRVRWVLPNGCLVVEFPGMLGLEEFLADPAEVELVSFETCSGIVNKYQHLEDFHWAVRPLLIALGLVSAMKTGVFLGGKIGRMRSQGSDEHLESRGKLAVWHSKVVKLF